MKVVGQKIEKMNKWIRIKIQKNEMIQKEIMNEMQRPNRNDTGATSGICYIHNIGDDIVWEQDKVSQK